MAFDGTDGKILVILQHDATLTYDEIGRKVNLSRDAVAKRIKKLRDRGVIQFQVAALNLDMIGPFVSAHVMCSFNPDGAATIDEFTRAVLARPEVVNSWTVTGDVDVILHVMTRTVPEYDEALRELQGLFPQLKMVRTHVHLRQTKRSLAVPFKF